MLIRILITLALLILTACIAPDGTSYTVATVDADNRLQVQTVEVSAEEEFYRGVWLMCVHFMYAEFNVLDMAGCTETTAVAYQDGLYYDAGWLEHCQWDLVQVEEVSR